MTATQDLALVPEPDSLWRPQIWTPIHGDGFYGREVAEFAWHTMVASKGMLAGQALDFAAWQRWALEFALQTNVNTGYFQFRQCVLGMPRKTAKSLMGAAIALYFMVGNAALGREIYSIAGDRMQARMVFGEARWQVLRNPALERELKVYRDAIEHRTNGSVYRVLSHDGKLAQGLNPFLTIADEAHVYPGTHADPKTSELWEAMAQGGGARPESLLLAITTAGNNLETLLGRLFQYGQKIADGAVEDSTFGMAWWEAPKGLDHRDEATWHVANPNLALGLADMDEMRSAAQKTPEHVFRRYRLNQFLHGSGITWMDLDAWAMQADPEWRPKPGEPIVMGFDGSVSDDATGLVGMTIRDPHLFVLGKWQRPEEAEDDWQVPRGEVDEAVADAFALYKVKSFEVDDAYWEEEFRRWVAKYGKRIVHDFTMSNARMVPAAQGLYAGITSGEVRHNDDPRLNEHVRNAIAYDTPSGTSIKKDSPYSTRKIDLAVCACMCNDARLRISPRGGPSVAGF